MVSLIIPTYGRSEFLIKAILSVPIDDDIEIIVVDDNGKGTNQQKLNQSELDNIQGYNIKYIPLKENSGASIARNIGADHSSEDYLAFIDDDDYILGASFVNKISFARKNKSFDLICSDMYIERQGKERKNSRFIGVEAKDFLLQGNCYTPMIMIKKESFYAIGGFSNVRYFQDFTFMLKCHINKLKVIHFKLETFVHVVHSDETITTHVRKTSDGILERQHLSKSLASQIKLNPKEIKLHKFQMALLNVQLSKIEGYNLITKLKMINKMLMISFSLGYQYVFQAIKNIVKYHIIYRFLL